MDTAHFIPGHGLMPALLLIFLVAVFSDQSLACSMDMDRVRELSLDLAGLQPDCSTYETRNHRFIYGFLTFAPLLLLGGFFCVFCIRLFSVFVPKKSQKRSIWTLARLSSTQVFDLVWATSFVTVWFMAVVFGYQMNGPAMTYAALFILLGLPVLRVMLAFTLDGLDNRREG